MPTTSQEIKQFIQVHPGAWSIDHRRFERITSNITRRNTCYEFYIHIRNGQFFQLNDEVFPLHPYQVVIIPPNNPHSLISFGELVNYECFSLRVQPEVLSLLTFGSTSLQNVVDRCCSQSHPLTYISPQEFMQLTAMASVIQPASASLPSLSIVEALGCLSVMISRFCSFVTDTPRNTPGVQDILMREVYNYILERFSEDCSLDILADRFSISKYHLSHRFAQTYGISVHQFVLRCRIAYAQLLIRQGEVMSQVYDRCGFSDYSSFVRAFTRIAGVSPREWRHQQAFMTISSRPASSM